MSRPETNRGSKEANARPSEDQLRLQAAALESAANGICITDRNGTIQWVNSSFERLTGYFVAELIGQNTRLLKSGKQDPAFYRNLWETITSGRVWQGQMVNKRKDGSFYDEEMTIAPVKDQRGEITHFIAIKQDVTRARQAEEALRQSEEKFRAVFEHAAIGIGRVSFADARWIDANEAFCQFLGYTREELLATAWPQITHPEDLQLDLVPFRRMAAGELETYTVEKRFIHKNGHSVWARLTLSLVRDAQGRPAYEIAVIEDVTQRKQAEAELQGAREDLARVNRDLERRVAERTAQLRETIAELEQMSYSMIHDMRAPLRAIQSFGDIVSQDPENRLTSESRELIDRMRTAAQRMDHLIRDVLNYSRVVRAELPLGPVDVGELARGILGTYPHLRPAGAETRVAPDFPLVLGNQAALTQCLSQLLSNAVKFARPEEPLRLHVKWERRDDGWVRIVVEDNGRGIPPQVCEKVFGMFQRLSQAGEGTGIGLTIVKKAVERMGGRVGVESKLNQGSRFWIELKAVPQDR